MQLDQEGNGDFHSTTFDLKKHFLQNGLSQAGLSKICKDIDGGDMNVEILIKFDEMELNNLSNEYNLTTLQRKAFIESIKMLPNAKANSNHVTNQIISKSTRDHESQLFLKSVIETNRNIVKNNEKTIDRNIESLENIRNSLKKSIDTIVNQKIQILANEKIKDKNKFRNLINRNTIDNNNNNQLSNFKNGNIDLETIVFKNCNDYQDMIKSIPNIVENVLSTKFSFERMKQKNNDNDHDDDDEKQKDIRIQTRDPMKYNVNQYKINNISWKFDYFYDSGKRGLKVHGISKDGQTIKCYHSHKNIACYCFYCINNIEMKPNSGIYHLKIKIDKIDNNYLNIIGITSDKHNDKNNIKMKKYNKYNDYKWHSDSNYIGWSACNRDNDQLLPNGLYCGNINNSKSKSANIFRENKFVYKSVNSNYKTRLPGWNIKDVLILKYNSNLNILSFGKENDNGKLNSYIYNLPKMKQFYWFVAHRCGFMHLTLL